MNITGLQELVFGVDDVAACSQYLIDYGLTPVQADASGGRFEAEDGTAIVLRRQDDPSLPAGLGTAAAGPAVLGGRQQAGLGRRLAALGGVDQIGRAHV